LDDNSKPSSLAAISQIIYRQVKTVESEEELFLLRREAPAQDSKVQETNSKTYKFTF